MSWKNAKTSFSKGICEKTTCTENSSPCFATEAGLFSNAVYVYGHQIFRRMRRSKTVFFKVNLGRKIVVKISIPFCERIFDLNVQRIDRFRQSKFFVFGKVQLTQTCFQMWFVDSLKHIHQIFKRIPKSNRNFFTANLPREIFFRKRFSFRHWLTVYLYSSMVVGLKQSFYQKINSIQSIYCFVLDVILRRRDNEIVIFGTIFPEITFDFANAWRTLLCFQLRLLRVPNLLHQMFNRKVRSDYNFFDVNFR